MQPPSLSFCHQLKTELWSLVSQGRVWESGPGTYNSNHKLYTTNVGRSSATKVFVALAHTSRTHSKLFRSSLSYWAHSPQQINICLISPTLCHLRSTPIVLHNTAALPSFLNTSIPVVQTCSIHHISQYFQEMQMTK